jgi:hypothetical protein
MYLIEGCAASAYLIEGHAASFGAFFLDFFNVRNRYMYRPFLRISLDLRIGYRQLLRFFLNLRIGYRPILRFFLNLRIGYRPFLRFFLNLRIGDRPFSKSPLLMSEVPLYRGISVKRKRPPPLEHQWALGGCLMQGPGGWRILMSETTVY